jgi:hypothetical protein
MSDMNTVETDSSCPPTADPLLCMAIAPLMVLPVSLPSLLLFVTINTCLASFPVLTIVIDTITV